MPQPCVAIQMDSLAVRTAVGDGIEHPLDVLAPHPFIRGEK
jgi:hypothetical protein